jgi:FdhD protein
VAGAALAADTDGMAHSTVRRQVVHITVAGGTSRRQDTLAAEEPLEIRVDGEPFTTTMRTPGHDLDLALGFLVGEGVIRGQHDVVRAAHCPDAVVPPRERVAALVPVADVAVGPPPAPAGSRSHNVVTVDLAPGVERPAPARHRHVTSACGVCGTATVDDVRARSPYDLRRDDLRVGARTLAGLPDTMRRAQRVFERTGGLHAAALFAPDGTPLCVREDVGRHNALDKVIGWAFTQGRLPLRGHILQVSGRASFELAQKAWLAGAPVLAAVSAPSSLAADLAADAGLTLVGFSRGDRLTVYAGAERITTDEPR